MPSSSERVLVPVSLVHLVSHLHMLAVPAMLPLLPAAMHVGFVELGIAIGVFNVVTALVQVPLGMLVDRLGARRILLAGLALGALSFALLAAVPTFPCLLASMALSGTSVPSMTRPSCMTMRSASAGDAKRHRPSADRATHDRRGRR